MQQDRSEQLSQACTHCFIATLAACAPVNPVNLMTDALLVLPSGDGSEAPNFASAQTSSPASAVGVSKQVNRLERV